MTQVLQPLSKVSSKLTAVGQTPTWEISMLTGTDLDQPKHKRSAVISKLPSAGDIKEARDLVDIENDLGDLGNDLHLRHLDSSKSSS
jgi:hypothetical protein